MAYRLPESPGYPLGLSCCTGATAPCPTLARYPETMARNLAMIALLPLILTGCSSAESEPTTNSVPTITKGAPAKATPAPASACLDVPQAVADNLAQAAEATKAGKSGAIKAPDSETWLIALELADGPASGETAVFETASITEAASSRAVNGMAKEFTGLPDSSYTVADDATDEAIACMK